MAVSPLSGLDARLRPAAVYALTWARKHGVQVTVTSVRRSRRKQQQLYNAYVNGRSRFPAAPPGTSAHEFGLAWDSFVEERYVPWWTAVREAVGFQVPSNDWVHAQVPNWEAWL
jgi:hypothetical protein